MFKRSNVRKMSMILALVIGLLSPIKSFADYRQEESFIDLKASEEVDGKNKQKNINSVEVSTFDELKNAVVNGIEEEIIILNDIEFESQIKISRAVNIKGVNKDIVLTRKDSSAEYLLVAETGNKDDIVKIEDLTMNGNYDENCFIGAIENKSSNVEINNVDFKNFSQGVNGAVILKGIGKIKIDNSLFQDNETIYNEGAAIFFSENSKYEANISNTKFINNNSVYGGALSIKKSTDFNLVLDNCTFSNNSATNNSQLKPGKVKPPFGGAVLVLKSKGDLTIRNCNFNENRVEEHNYFGEIEEGSGGAIAVMSSDLNTTIIDSTFTNNSSKGYGGALFINDEDSVNTSTNTIITGTKFENNSTVKHGGAVSVLSMRMKSDIKIENSFFNENKSTNGGGFSYSSYGNIDIDNTSFTGNTVTSGGGAIYFNPYTNNGIVFNLKNSKIENNKVINDDKQTYGGGLYIFAGSGERTSEVNINNTKIAYNESGKKGLGGGIFTRGIEGLTLNILETEISNNFAQSGGGICNVQIPKSEANIDKSNFKDNKAIVNGGAINVGYLSTAVMQDSNYTLYNNLKVKETSFSGNIADNGIYELDKEKYPNIYSVYESNISNIKSLSTPAIVNKNIVYNNYDICFIGDKNIEPIKEFTVTYDSNGGSKVEPQTVNENEKFTKPENPTKDGYVFEGWYTDTGLTKEYNFDTEAIDNITLYAKWTKKAVDPTEPEKPGGTIKDITLIGGKATLTEKVEEQLKEFKLNRISGKDRYTTSVQVSKAYKNSNTIVLASGEKYTDELTATVLASKLDVPILLSEKDVVPEVVIKEIERLGATKVILIGEKGTLSKSVETQLSKYKLERIGGVDRYETAVLIGDQVRTITGNKTQSILVDGTNFPDAIAMTSMGVEQGLPIILTQPNELNKITEKAVKDWGITKVTIGGGTASVSSNIENTLKATVEVERIKGRDRYETSVLVAKQVYKNPTHAVVASGEVFPDAIVGAPYAAKNKYPIVLSRGNSVPSVVMDYVNGK